MKVLLANPPTSSSYFKEDRCTVKFKPLSFPRVPINLMYLGAISEKSGNETRIIDCPVEGISLEAFRKRLGEFMPDLFVANVATGTLEDDMVAVRAAKEIAQAGTIAIGSHVTAFDVQSLESRPHLDLVIRQEPEGPFELLLLKGKTRQKIKGITYRDSGRIVRNEDAGFVDDLDALPFPARELIRNEKYIFPDTGEACTTIQVARGCPFGCSFCSAALMSGSGIRLRSPESVVSEAKETLERFGIKTFFFRGDTVTADRKWMLKLCSVLESSGMNKKIRWFCNSRVNTVDPELLKTMKESGCFLIGYGVESGSQEILDGINKKITLEQAIQAMGWTRRAGILSIAFYILGLPGESEEQIKRTIGFSKKVDSDFVEYHEFQPFPGTPAFGLKAIMVPHGKVDGYIMDAYRSYYMRPSYILRTLKRMRSATEFLNYVRHGSGKFLNFAFGKGI